MTAMIDKDIRTRGILNPAFRYTPSHQTDIRVRFDRIRREQREAAELAEARQREADAEQAAHKARVQESFERRRRLKVAK